MFYIMAYDKVLIHIPNNQTIQYKMGLTMINKQYVQETEESGEQARDFIKVFVEGVGLVYSPKLGYEKNG